MCAKCLICFPQQGLRKEMILSSLVSLPPSNIKAWFLLPKSQCVCVSVCVYSRQADSYVLPQQCDVSSGHDAVQPGERLLLEERVWEGPQVPASGNHDISSMTAAGPESVRNL